MSRKLTLLFVGSTARISQQIREALSDAPYDLTVRCVPECEATRAALDNLPDSDAVDLVIYQHEGGGNGISKWMRRSGVSELDIPVLVLSESDDAQAAVRALRAGAQDWIITHHLGERLPPAIEHALSDLERCRRCGEIAAQLEESRHRYHELAEALPQGVYELDLKGRFTFVNQRGLDLFGYTRDDLKRRPHVATMLAEKDRDRAMQRIRAMLDGAVPDDGAEYSVISGEGTLIPVLVHAAPIKHDDEIIGVRGVVTDLREMRETRQQLQQSEERYRRLVETMADGLLTLDRHGAITYANQALAEIFEVPVEHLIGNNICTMFDEKNAAILTRQIERRFNEGVPGAYEVEADTGTGRRVTLRITATPLRDDADRVIASLGVVTDITEQRRSEERRRLARARLSLINRLNQMLNAGESPEEIIAAGADELRDVLDAHHVHIFTRQMDGDSDRLVMRYSNMPPEIVRQIPDAESEDHTITLSLHPDSQLWEVYQTGELMEIREEDLGRTMSEIKRWAEPSPLRNGMSITRDLGIRYLCLMPLTHGDETMGHVTISRSEDEPLTTMEKALLEGFAHQMAVILDKARTEREISRLNQLLEGIIENAAVWFTVLDEDRDLIIWNRAAEEISGYSREEIRSSAHLMELLYPDEERRRHAREHLDAAFRGEWHEELETSITVADGSERRIAWHLRTFDSGPGGKGLVIIGRDVTESHQLHEQLQRVQRMDAVGTLAGGIAHDFNNVLTAIIGHAELLADESEEDSSMQWHTNQITENARRASRLTRQLLAFSRKQPSEPEVVNLNRLIRNMEEMFRRVMPEDIDLQLDLRNDLGHTEIDPSQVEQIVMNLVLNARDAMPDGGELQIRTANATLSDDSLTDLFDAQPGEYVTLEVLDTGVGMDEETESHIFEPFFTTKQNNGGTGLGLSTVYGLVRQSKGAITVYSELGEGTLFRIYLPRVDLGESTQNRIAHTDQTALRGDETLLVVEDADNLRDLIGTILDMFGYTVFTAAMGEEALALEEDHRGEIDLVITDVVMPGMSGTELADKLLEVSPELKILFISGYPTDRAISAGHTDGRFSFLQKPFSATELGRKVREMLQ